MRQLLLVLLCLCPSSATTAAERFVAPAGQPANAGTRESPWDIASALDGTQKVQAGDTLWLLAGTYRRRPEEQFTVKLPGTADQPIHVRGESGRRVTIDGGLKVEDPSVGVWLRDLELLVSEAQPTMPLSPGTHPPEFTRPWGGLHVYGGKHCKFINLVIHDCRQGVSWWKQSIDSDLYGCVIFGNGWPGTDRGHGHCIYTQNKDGAKLISNCILSAVLSGQQTVQAYGSENAYVDNFLCEDNVAYGMGRFLIGGGRPSNNIRVHRNHLYQVDLQLGYDAPSNADCELLNNRIFRGSLVVQNYQTVKQEGTWIFKEDERPTTTEAFVLPNAYEPGRAHVVVYNWSGEKETTVAVGKVFAEDQGYVLHDPKRMYEEPVYSGTINNGMATVPTPGEFTVLVLRKR
jgi:hypothetical protein